MGDLAGKAIERPKIPIVRAKKISASLTYKQEGSLSGMFTNSLFEDLDKTSISVRIQVGVRRGYAIGVKIDTRIHWLISVTPEVASKVCYRPYAISDSNFSELPPIPPNGG
jgi:hypothetical protein